MGWPSQVERLLERLVDDQPGASLHSVPDDELWRFEAAWDLEPTNPDAAPVRMSVTSAVAAEFVARFGRAGALGEVEWPVHPKTGDNAEVLGELERICRAVFRGGLTVERARRLGDDTPKGGPIRWSLRVNDDRVIHGSYGALSSTEVETVDYQPYGA